MWSALMPQLTDQYCQLISDATLRDHSRGSPDVLVAQHPGAQGVKNLTRGGPASETAATVLGSRRSTMVMARWESLRTSNRTRSR